MGYIWKGRFLIKDGSRGEICGSYFFDARKASSIMKEVRVMEYLLAKSDRQLGICLRMLYDEGYTNLVIESVMNAKNRMEFHVKVRADEDKLAKLNDRYQTLIS